MPPRSTPTKKWARVPTTPPSDRDVTENEEIEVEVSHRRVIAQGWEIAEERGITFPTGQKYRKYTAIITALGWGQFSWNPVAPCLPLVHEFYANLHLAKKNKVPMLGKAVSYFPEAIDNLFGIHHITHLTLFNKLCKATADVTEFEIHHTLSLGRGIRHKDGGKTIKTSCLSNEAKFWRKFIAGRLLGSTTDGECPPRVQYLLFTILLGQAFSIGDVIYDAIEKSRRHLVKGLFGHMSLAFPSIITMLCDKRGIVHPAPADPKTVRRIMDEGTLTVGDETTISTREFHLKVWGVKIPLHGNLH